jgi:chromosome segregation ATPase
MTSYAVHRPHDKKPSDVSHSKSRLTSFDSDPGSEEFDSAASEQSWASQGSHKDLIHQIKKLLDVTDDDHERLLKEIKDLKTARQMAINACQVLNSENDSLLHAKHNLQEEVEQLQKMLSNINTHVTAFMENYMSLHGEESENASRHASHHGTTHDHASQAQHAAGSRNTDRDPQQPHEDTSVRSRVGQATKMLKNWDDMEDFAPRESHRRHLSREMGHA